jgi:hypothetical protein
LLPQAGLFGSGNVDHHTRRHSGHGKRLRKMALSGVAKTSSAVPRFLRPLSDPLCGTI